MVRAANIDALAKDLNASSEVAQTLFAPFKTTDVISIINVTSSGFDAQHLARSSWVERNPSDDDCATCFGSKSWLNDQDVTT